MRTSFTFLSFLIAVCLFLPLSLTAAEYTVGPGGTWATLEALRTATGVLRDGDTIVLNGDDNSLTGSFTTTLTLKGSGVISPATSNLRFLNASAKNMTLDTDSVEFRNFKPSSGSGGVINGTNVTLSNGTNTFADNTAVSSGGAIYTSSRVTLSGGTNTFANNSSTGSYGGAIYGSGGATLSGGTNTFTGNSSSSNGGAIDASTGGTTISGGINTFIGNTSRNGVGGAICGYSTVTFSGGENTFIGNSAGSNGGAIYVNSTTTISGGTNTFTGNWAGGGGGAIYCQSNATLRATDGDFTFQGNRDRVTMSGGTVVPGSGYANAIYAVGNLTLAAQEGQSIYFYDPVVATATGNSISINNLATDTGRVVFDGSDYTRDVDRTSRVYGNTTVGYGELALKGNVIYGEANNVGTFMLNEWATLTSDNTTNRIQANRITMNGTVDIANGGTLELAAALGVNFSGTLNVGLGLDAFGDTTSGFLSTIGNLTFGTNAMLSVYGDDSLFTANSWSNVYNLYETFNATGNITGLANLMFDASWFDAYDGFSYTLDRGILTLSYTAAEVPEPATLLMLGLGLAGLPVVRRLRRG